MHADLDAESMDFLPECASEGLKGRLARAVARLPAVPGTWQGLLEAAARKQRFPTPPGHSVWCGAVWSCACTGTYIPIQYNAATLVTLTMEANLPDCPRWRMCGRSALMSSTGPK